MNKLSTVVMDGKLVAGQIYSDISKRALEGLARKPKLAIILIGNDAPSQIYIKQKIKACEELGFEYILDARSEDKALSTADVVNLVEQYNKDQSVTGMIVQMPLPAHIDKQEVIKAISPKKDVDGIHPLNFGLTVLGREFENLTPCTATGVVKMLEFFKIELEGKKVVVIGSGIIAGKPIAAMLSNRRATVTICNSKTKDLAEYTVGADIIVVAVGRAKLLKASMVKEGAVVIDVGISRGEDGKIVGDTDFEGLWGKVAYISPVPGGVGKLTVACLMSNLLKSAL